MKPEDKKMKNLSKQVRKVSIEAYTETHMDREQPARSQNQKGEKHDYNN